MAIVSALPVRAWYAADRALHLLKPSRVGVVARAVHGGLWLGAAPPEVLVAIDEEAYARRYAYHDTDDHNLRGWFDWEREVLATAFPPSGRVVLTAAGGGREVVALRRSGYEVVAGECNEVLRARANGLLLRLGMVGDVLPLERDHALVGCGTFDAAVVGWGSYTFVRGGARRVAFLRELRASLRPGAPVLLSFFARTRDSRRLHLVRTVANAVAGVTGREPTELGDVLDPTWQHYFSREELEAELVAAGMMLERWSTEGYAHAVARVVG